MRARHLLAVVTTGLVVTSCLSTDPGLTATGAVPQTLPADTVPTVDSVPVVSPAADPATVPDTVPPSKNPDNEFAVEPGIVDFGDGKPGKSYDGFLVAVVKDIQAYWAEEFPAVYGRSYQPLDGGIHAAFRRRTDPIPGCGKSSTRFRDVEGNAFYCSIGDFMVYDDETLVPALVDNLGRSAIGVVMAHEFGHAVQARADEMGQPTILKEQQADCFAGAWTARIARGENDVFQFDDRDVRAGLIAMLQVADPVEVAGLSDADAHGTGFDRVGAFQDGFVGGAQRCKPFFTENRQLVDVPFDRGDANAGNFPLHDPAQKGSDVATAIPRSLTAFWTELLAAKGVSFQAPALVLYPADGPYPACEGAASSAFRRNVFYCRATNQIMADETMGARIVSEIGDMSLGYLISQGFSEAVQVTLNSTLRGEDRALQNDCLTGVWTKELIPTDSATSGTIPPDAAERISLSAGDLDEAVITAIQRSDTAASTNVRGSAFEKIAAFRQGVLAGPSACSVLG